MVQLRLVVKSVTPSTPDPQADTFSMVSAGLAQRDGQKALGTDKPVQIVELVASDRQDLPWRMQGNSIFVTIDHASDEWVVGGTYDFGMAPAGGAAGSGR